MREATASCINNGLLFNSKETKFSLYFTFPCSFSLVWNVRLMVMRGEIFAWSVIKICLRRIWWFRFEKIREKKANQSALIGSFFPPARSDLVHWGAWKSRLLHFHHSRWGSQRLCNSEKPSNKSPAPAESVRCRSAKSEQTWHRAMWT